MKREKLYTDAINLLKRLIEIPSFSSEEEETADFLEDKLRDLGLQVYRKNNNIWVKQLINNQLPTILLNSHLDTIRPVEGWTLDPFQSLTVDNKIFGLGSNDAGASLVALLVVFIYFSHSRSLPFNLVYAATAEEETSGDKGIRSILEDLGDIQLGIIGEPTGMKMAIAEKGLLVLDCIAEGRSSHAALDDGENAIYKAMADINWIRNYSFVKQSKLLGEITMNVTQISGGYKHNVIPDRCSFVVDVRTNECYTNNEIIAVIKDHLSSEVTPRSLRLNSSSISLEHPVVQKGLSIGLEYFGSATLSDQVHMQFPTIKMGPGDSARSHTANEYIIKTEIKKAVDIYIRLLTDLKIET